MKQPLWILNSSLLVLFFISQSLLFMLQRAVPTRVSIEPGTISTIVNKTITPVDVASIYENDLFNTYVPQNYNFEKIDDNVAPIPEPPQRIVPQIPIEKAPTFFSPLDVLLKGVIFVENDPSKSLVIIQDKKSKEENNYQVGDLIEDAQILKILPNRAVVIRSNGQQETLYLREEDAAYDFNNEENFSPKKVVVSSIGNNYQVDIDEFAKRVHNIGEFIGMLDLTTVYKQGKSLGCRVGRISKDSLGSALGFKFDDIIMSVDTISSMSLENRMQMYDHIVEKRAGDTINVEINRGESNLQLGYSLINDDWKKLNNDLQAAGGTSSTSQDASDKDNQSRSKTIDNSQATNENISKSAVDTVEEENPIRLNQQTMHELENHTKRLFLEREKLAPTLKEMEFQERRNMLQRGKRNVILDGVKK